jgi:putative tricarboxylic transport membrane protein
MDRLEVRQIHPASIPGLVPMVLGVLLFGCAVILYRSARAELKKSEAIEYGEPLRLLGTGVLCLIYAVGLIGRVPFYLGTFLFIVAFVALFTWKNDAGSAGRLRWFLVATVTGAIASTVISNLFQHGFLVRLP